MHAHECHRIARARGVPEQGLRTALAVAGVGQVAPRAEHDRAGTGSRSVSFIDGDKLAEVESGKEQAVVFYYSTQCGFCHEALPEFLKASNAPGAAKPKLHLYAVEASNAKTDNPLVKVFPTVILYGLPGAQKPEAVVGAKQASDYAKLFDRY